MHFSVLEAHNTTVLVHMDLTRNLYIKIKALEPYEDGKFLETRIRMRDFHVNLRNACKAI